MMPTIREPASETSARPDNSVLAIEAGNSV
jgi:hypothetical protein